MFCLLYFYRADAESVSSRAEAESLSTTDSHQIKETDRALTTRPLSQKRKRMPSREKDVDVLKQIQDGIRARHAAREEMRKTLAEEERVVKEKGPEGCLF